MTYFTLCIIALVFFYLAERKNRFSRALGGIMILTIVAGWRDYSVGTDTNVYHTLFTNFYTGFGGTYFREKGFMIIARWITRLFGNDRMVFVLYALIINYSIIWMLWKLHQYCSFTMMSFLYVTLFFPQSMNILRQFVGLAIVFAATRMLFKNRYILYLIVVSLSGILFHRSMFVAVPIALIWFLLNNKGVLKRWVIMCLVLLCIPFVVTPIMSEAMQYSGYFLHANFSISKTLIAELILFVSYCFGVIFKKSVKPSEVNTMIMDKFFTINYGIGLLFSLIGCFYVYMGRIGLCYSLMCIPCIARISKNNRYSPLYRLAYIALALFYIIVKVAINGETGIIPYAMG